NRELEAQAAEAQHLEILLNFHQAHPETPMLAAQVIGASADPISRTIVINCGERDHVRRNLAVITPDGVVGKIVEVLPSTSQVQLINDKDSGVGALFAVSRTQGVVKGSGGPDPRMEYVVNDEKVQPGELILTSGEDRIFPKGLPIGTVEKATPGNPFQTILVKPAVRLDRLEDVIVLLTMQEIASPKAEEGSAGESGDTPAESPKAPAVVHAPRAASQNSSSKPAPAQTAPAPIP
ncbi:MAG: rod shape-determining protein MreC, partial [Candidatus Acidiferrales bacterium]